MKNILNLKTLFLGLLMSLSWAGLQAQQAIVTGGAASSKNLTVSSKVAQGNQTAYVLNASGFEASSLSNVQNNRNTVSSVPLDNLFSNFSVDPATKTLNVTLRDNLMTEAQLLQFLQGLLAPQRTGNTLNH